MKNLKVAVWMVTVALLSLPALSQKGKVVLHPTKVSGETHFHVNDFPKDMVLPAVYGWGGLAVDLKLVSFSPEAGMHHLTEHLEKKVAEMQAQ